MNHEHADNLELELAALTRGVVAEPVLWKRALNATKAPAQASPRSVLQMRIRPAILTAAAAIVLCVVLVGAMLPSLGKARSSARVPVASARSEYSMEEQAPAGVMGEMAGSPLRDAESPTGLFSFTGGATPPVAGLGFRASSRIDATPEARAVPSDRLVIRKAQIELRAADVRTAYMKAAMILSEAQSEYVEESGLSGHDAVIKDGQIVQHSTLTGTLKLRVAATRVGAVLGQLRELGVVETESAGGEDITDQFVDLEARLRNEQKVEAELLTLLESRKDATLEDILKLRNSIAPVRENIERMLAQRDRLSRLVSLATVLVVIRAEAAPVPEPVKSDDGMGAYFQLQVEQAWERSLRSLVDTAAWLVRVLVGGAPVWAVLVVVALGIRLAWRRYQRALANEPAPKGV